MLEKKELILNMEAGNGADRFLAPYFMYAELEKTPSPTIMIPKYTTDFSAAWKIHEVACTWIFSKRQRYFKALQEIVSQGQEMKQGDYLIAWPDVLVLMKPIHICKAALLVELGLDK